MKHLFGIIIIILFAADASSQANSQITGLQGTQVQWVHYLSDKEKVQIAHDLAIESIHRQEATGTLYDLDQFQEISFAASFRPKNSTLITGESTDTGIPATASGISGGNVSCSINIQYPHAGLGPGPGDPIVVKAKSAGGCTYIHVTGTPPPTITWELLQVLTKSAHWPPLISTNSAVRTGLDPRWNSTNTQVFSNNCLNGTYIHGNSIFVIPPPGWEYTGPQPIQIPNPVTVDITSC